MALTKEQMIIKRNFSKHAEISAQTIVDSFPIPKTKSDYKTELYKSMMVFMSAAFQFEKIIIKNNPK